MNQCDGQFRIAVTAMLVLLAKATVVVRVEEERGKEKEGLAHRAAMQLEFALKSRCIEFKPKSH